LTERLSGEILFKIIQKPSSSTLRYVLALPVSAQQKTRRNLVSLTFVL